MLKNGPTHMKNSEHSKPKSVHGPNQELMKLFKDVQTANERSQAKPRLTTNLLLKSINIFLTKIHPKHYFKKKEKNMIDTLITHSGVFHGDDVLAYTIPDAQLVRTRDTNLIEKKSETSIVFDVGNTYEPHRHVYDHHQPNPPKRENDIPYSSFGLIWKHFGKRWLTKQADIPLRHLDTTWKAMDENLVEHVDKVDNGVLDTYESTQNDITSLILRSNPNPLTMKGDFDTIQNSQKDEAFKQTAQWAGHMLKQQAQTIGREQIGKDILQTALNQQNPKGFVVLDKPVPWTKTLFECQNHQSALYVAFPTDNDDEWGIQTVPTKPQGFQARQWFPEKWRGKRNEDMEKESGVKNAHFCHTAGFFCAVKEKKAALEIGQKAIQSTKTRKKEERDF